MDSTLYGLNSHNKSIDKKLAEIDEDFFINGIFYDIYENPLQLNSLKTNISYRSLRKTFLENFKFSFQKLDLTQNDAIQY